MADTSVYINGAAEGALADAFSGLPAWATQATLFDIEGILKKSLESQNKALAQLMKSAAATGTMLDPEDVKKVKDGLEDWVKNLSDANKQAEKDKIAADKRTKTEKAKATQEEKRKTFFQAFDKVLGGLIAAGSKVLEVQSQYYKTTTDLFDSGVNVLAGQEQTTSSLLSMNQMVIMTGLRLETLQKVVEKYTGSINAVGLLKFTKAISLTNQRLQDLGYNAQQQADLIGTLIESESSYSDIRSKSSKEIADDSVVLGTQLRKLSLQYGISVDALKENVKEQAKSTDTLYIMAQYGDKAALSFDTFVGSFKDKNVGNMMSDLVSAGAQAFNTPKFQELAQSGFADVLDRMNKIGQLGLTDAEAAHREFDQYVQTIGSDRINQLRILEKSNGPAAASAHQMAEILNGARIQALQASKATKSQTDAQLKNASINAGLATQLESRAAWAEKIFVPLESQIQAATNALILMNNAVNGVTNSISASTRSWIGVGIEAVALGAILFKTGSTIKDIGSGLKIAGPAIADAFTGLRGAVNSIGPILGRFGTGIGVAAAGAFAAYEVFNLIKALKDKSDAKDKLEESKKSLSATEARINALSPEDRARFDAMGSGVGPQTSATSISIPKNPMQSTINSPSAVAVAPVLPAGDVSAPSAQSPNPSVGSGIEKPPRTSDINSLLTYQNSISEQLLLSMQKLVSVNGEILQVSRTH